MTLIYLHVINLSYMVVRSYSMRESFTFKVNSTLTEGNKQPWHIYHPSRKFMYVPPHPHSRLSWLPCCWHMLTYEWYFTQLEFLQGNSVCTNHVGFTHLAIVAREWSTYFPVCKISFQYRAGMSHQRWIWEIHFMQAMKLASEGIYPVQGLFVPFACVGFGDPVRVLRLFHNKYTGYNWSIYCWDFVQLVATKSNVQLY